MVTKMLLLSPPGCWIMPHIWTWFQQGRWDQGNHWGRACDPCPLGVGAEPPAQRTWGGDTYDPDPLITAAPIAVGSRSRGTRDPFPSEQSCLWPQPLSPHLQQQSPQTYMYSPVYNIGAQATLAAPTPLPCPVVWSLWRGGGSQAPPKTHHPCAAGNSASDAGSSEAAKPQRQRSNNRVQWHLRQAE